MLWKWAWHSVSMAPPKEQPQRCVSATAIKLEHTYVAQPDSQKKVSRSNRMSTILDLVAIFDTRCILAHPASPYTCNFLCVYMDSSGNCTEKDKHFASLNVVRVRHCFRGSGVRFPSDSTRSSYYSLFLYAAKRQSNVPTHGVSAWWLY